MRIEDIDITDRELEFARIYAEVVAAPRPAEIEPPTELLPRVAPVRRHRAPFDRKRAEDVALFAFIVAGLVLFVGCVLATFG